MKKYIIHNNRLIWRDVEAQKTVKYITSYDEIPPHYQVVVNDENIPFLTSEGKLITIPIHLKIKDVFPCASPFKINTHTFAINEWDEMWDWTGRNIPTKGVFNEYNFCQISLSLAYAGIDKDNVPWGWGVRRYAGINQNINGWTMTPVKIYGNHKFKYITGRAGIDENNKGWTWGRQGIISSINLIGVLGNNVECSQELTPVQIYGNHNWKKISTGLNSTTALDLNGKAWAWGGNNGGVLGDGTTTRRITPVEVYGNHSFVDIDGGMGLTDDGKLWCWGGMTGDGTNTARTTPVEVYGNHTFCSIARGHFRAAIDNHGIGWSWGTNMYGQLGDGGPVLEHHSTLTPTKIYGNHTFCKIKGYSYNCKGIDINGRLWSWGRGPGTGGLISYTCTPVAVCI